MAQIRSCSTDSSFVDVGLALQFQLEDVLINGVWFTIRKHLNGVAICPIKANIERAKSKDINHPKYFKSGDVQSVSREEKKVIVNDICIHFSRPSAATYWYKIFLHLKQ